MISFNKKLTIIATSVFIFVIIIFAKNLIVKHQIRRDKIDRIFVYIDNDFGYISQEEKEISKKEISLCDNEEIDEMLFQIKINGYIFTDRDFIQYSVKRMNTINGTHANVEGALQSTFHLYPKTVVTEDDKMFGGVMLNAGSALWRNYWIEKNEK